MRRIDFLVKGTTFFSKTINTQAEVKSPKMRVQLAELKMAKKRPKPILV